MLLRARVLTAMARRTIIRGHASAGKRRAVLLTCITCCFELLALADSRGSRRSPRPQSPGLHSSENVKLASQRSNQRRLQTAAVGGKQKLSVTRLAGPGFIWNSVSGVTPRGWSVSSGAADVSQRVAADDRRLSVERRLEGSPTLESFTFDASLQEMCRDRSQDIDIRRLPLRLPSNRDSCDMLLTKSTAEADLASEQAWFEHIDGIKEHLADEVCGGRRLYASCAVVGNSGNLMHTGWGQDIDAHEAVFRFNRGPTNKMFGRWVGSRTDFRVLNGAESRLYASDGLLREGPMKRMEEQPPSVQGNIAVGKGVKELTPIEANSTIVLSRTLPNETAALLEGIRMQATLRNLTGFQLTLLGRLAYHYAEALLKAFRQCLALREEEDLDSYATFRSPSSGLMVTMAAIHLCKRVSVYGIGESPRKGSPYQYHMNRRSRKYGAANTRSHNFPLEADWMRYLAEEGLIRKCEHGSCWKGRQPTSVRRRETL